ncbi:MAG: alanine racemase [Acidobacteria bacterium]|nr:alanine racemase [Acidobacteriota bacterium]MBI3488885.1 alanine racemase [Acidobacteriota bacterium]
MFLQSLKARNPELIRAAVRFHREGSIPANSYVLDLDAMEENARLLSAEAAKHGLRVFGMAKQFSRHAQALNAVAKGGIDAFVAVDLACARAIHGNGHRLGHLGHLVQIPQAEAATAMAMTPDYWTVFSLDKAREISEHCRRKGSVQSLLLRIHAEGDTFYHGHEGGFSAETLETAVEAIQAMEGLRFAGLTSFPALLYDGKAQEVLPTHNLATLKQAAARLSGGAGRHIEINAPGTTSCVALQTLAEAGATQVEPGHALTGTTPLHAVRELPERPAMLHLSEVSHAHGGKPFFFGGGLYIDPVFPDYPLKALVGADPDALMAQEVAAEIPPDSAIDYYGILHPSKSQRIRTGDTVILGFRAQAFVTRAYVVGIEGLASGQPQVSGIHSSDGRDVRWP